MFSTVVIVLVVVIYNALVYKKNRVQEASSGIDVMLKKRFDLIPNLVEIVKSYTSHEKDTLEGIVSLRSKALKAESSQDKMQFDKDISLGVFKIFAMVENYPELKASLNFLQIQSELSDVETDIERSKRYYNTTVRELNIAVQSFPGNIVASSFGFTEEEFFELRYESQRESVNISL